MRFVLAGKGALLEGGRIEKEDVYFDGLGQVQKVEARPMLDGFQSVRLVEIEVLAQQAGQGGNVVRRQVGHDVDVQGRSRYTQGRASYRASHPVGHPYLLKGCGDLP